MTSPTRQGAGLTAWVLTTGEDGMRSQARGLAGAVADVVAEKRVPPDGPIGWLTFGLGRPRLGGDLVAPWPDLLVSCGRRSAPVAAAVKRAGGGRTVAVHVQDPRACRGDFDLIVAMAHDRLAAGPRVIKIDTALHDVTAASLEAAGRAWRERLAPLGRPLAGVLVGGDLRGRPFTFADADRLTEGLARLRAGGTALAVTPSRRTPEAVRARIAGRFAGDPGVFVWDLAGDNPYRGILALADRLVATTDSVSMVSEAMATGRPVELLDLDFPRHRGFVQGLVDRGFARRFQGDAEPPPPPPIADPIPQVAMRVRALLQARTGVSG